MRQLRLIANGECSIAVSLQFMKPKAGQIEFRWMGGNVKHRQDALYLRKPAGIDFAPVAAFHKALQLGALNSLCIQHECKLDRFPSSRQASRDAIRMAMASATCRTAAHPSMAGGIPKTPDVSYRPAARVHRQAMNACLVRREGANRRISGLASIPNSRRLCLGDLDRAIFHRQ